MNWNPMPRYFFNVHDHENLPDEDGLELPDRQAARVQAVRYAGELLKDIDGKLTGAEWSMTITDEAGRLIMTLRFSATEH